tara:strand:+ start:2334 stop:2804 length:471 start_codon:yes stop_codon:yes gene_type:complete
MPRSPNYDPSRHGTGWPSSQPSKTTVAYLDNPFVTDEQRMEVFSDNSVTPPPSLGGAIAVVDTTPAIIERGAALIQVRNPFINWIDFTPEIYRLVLNTNDPMLTGRPEPDNDEPSYDIPTGFITTRPAPTIENSIVTSFTPLSDSDTAGIFGLKDE